MTLYTAVHPVDTTKVPRSLSFTKGHRPSDVPSSPRAMQGGTIVTVPWYINQ